MTTNIASPTSADLDTSALSTHQAGRQALAAADQLGHRWSKQAETLRNGATGLEKLARRWLHDREHQRALEAAVNAPEPDVTEIERRLHDADLERRAVDTRLLDPVVQRANGMRLAALRADAEAILTLLGKHATSHLNVTRQNAPHVGRVNPADTCAVSALSPEAFTQLAACRDALAALGPLVEAGCDLLHVLGWDNSPATKAKLLTATPDQVNRVARRFGTFNGSPYGPLHALLVTEREIPGTIGWSTLAAIRAHDARAAQLNARRQLDYVTQHPATGDLATYQQRYSDATTRVRELETTKT